MHECKYSITQSRPTGWGLGPSRGIFLQLAVLVLVISFALFPIAFWFFDFRICAPTSALVVVPPGVPWRRSTIHGSLHIAKVGLAVLTRAIATPPMLTIQINFIVEAVVNLGIRHIQLVD